MHDSRKRTYYETKPKDLRTMFKYESSKEDTKLSKQQPFRKSDYHDKWMRVAQSDYGTERIGPLGFASVRKDDTVLVVPCLYGNECHCVKYAPNRSLVTVETISGYRSHLDTRLLDLENPLQLVCRICPPSEQVKLDKQTALLDHIKRVHLSEKIRPLMNSRPPYKCLFFSKCHYSSEVSVNDVINHILDPKATHGSVNYLKLLLSNFIETQPKMTKEELGDDQIENGHAFKKIKLEEKMLNSDEKIKPDDKIKLEPVSPKKEDIIDEQLSKDNGMLTKQISKYQNTLKSIQNDVVIPLKDKMTRIDLENQALKMKIDSFKKESLNLTPNTNRNTDWLEKEIRSLNRNLSQLEAEISSKESMINSIELEKDQEISDLQKEVLRLKNNNNMQNTNKSSDPTSVTNKQTKISELEQQNQDLSIKIAFLEGENKKYIKLEVLKSEESKKLDKEKRLLKKEVVRLEADIAAKQSFIDELSTEQNKKVSHLEEEIEKLKSNEITLIKENREQNKKVSHLEEEIEKLKTNETTLIKENKEQHKKVSRLEEEIEKLNSNELTLLNTMKNAQNSRSDRLEEQVKSLKSNLSQSEAEIASKKSTIKKMELEKDKQVSQLEEQIRSLKNKEKTVQNTNTSQSEKLEKEVKSLSKKVVELKAENVTKQSKIDEKSEKLEKEIKSLRKEIVDLKADNASKKSKIDEKRSKIERKEKTIKDLTKKVTQLEEDKSSKQLEMEELCKKITQLEDENASKKSSLERMESKEKDKMIQLESKIRSLKHRDKMLNKNIRRSSESDKLESEIEMLNSKLVTLQAENDSKQTIIDGMRDKEDKTLQILEEKIQKLKHNEKALTKYVAKTVEEFQTNKDAVTGATIAEKDKRIEELEFDLDWYKQKDSSEMKDKIHYFHDHISQATISKLQTRLDGALEENSKMGEQLMAQSKKSEKLSKLLKIRDAEIAVMKDCDVTNDDSISDKATNQHSETDFYKSDTD